MRYPLVLSKQDDNDTDSKWIKSFILLRKHFVAIGLYAFRSYQQWLLF